MLNLLDEVIVDPTRPGGRVLVQVRDAATVIRDHIAEVGVFVNGTNFIGVSVI